MAIALTCSLAVFPGGPGASLLATRPWLARSPRQSHLIGHRPLSASPRISGSGYYGHSGRVALRRATTSPDPVAAPGADDHDREEFSFLWNELFTLKKLLSG